MFLTIINSILIQQIIGNCLAFESNILYIFFFVQMKLSLQELKLINVGTNSEIYQYGCQGKSVAIKAVPTNFRKQCRHLINEYETLTGLQHDNIIKALKFKQNVHLQGMGSSYNQKDNKKIVNVIILENAKHGSLLQFYRKNEVTVGQARWIFSELCQAVSHLHRNYIVHRDLKLDNAMVFQNQSQILVKLGDFGYATSTRDSANSSSYKGTKRGYMAPQIHQVLLRPESSYNMYKSDIFALGVIMFGLCMKRLPFETATTTDPHYRLIYAGKLDEFWKTHEKYPCSELQQDSLYQDFKQIFMQMVDPNPEKRPSIQQLFKSSWMMGRQQLILPRNKQLKQDS